MEDRSHSLISLSDFSLLVYRNESDFTTKCNLRFNAIPIKLAMAFFTELKQKKIIIHMETQKTLKSQSSLKKEEWNWRNQAF